MAVTIEIAVLVVVAGLVGSVLAVMRDLQASGMTMVVASHGRLFGW